MAIVPKGKVSKARRNSRKANWKISTPSMVECPHCHELKANHRVCKKCGYKMSHVKMIIAKDSCYRCGKDMNIAMIEANPSFQIYSPADFTKEQIDIANTSGANIKLSYSNQVKESYYANVCRCCNAFIGNFHMHDYYFSPHVKELDLGYYCYHCVEMEEQRIYEEKMKIQRLLNEKLVKDGHKTCPQCGARLLVRKSSHGYFYGCKNYPNCNYTENIILES